jgi:hypothetical protein
MQRYYAPAKVMGIGAEIESSGRTFDYCTMHETCRYQEHY